MYFADNSSCSKHRKQMNLFFFFFFFLSFFFFLFFSFSLSFLFLFRFVSFPFSVSQFQSRSWRADWLSTCCHVRVSRLSTVSWRLYLSIMHVSVYMYVFMDPFFIIKWGMCVQYVGREGGV